MKHYISKDALVAEINRLEKVNQEYKKTWKCKFKWFYRTIIGRLEVLEGLKAFVNTLEVKEETELSHSEVTKISNQEEPVSEELEEAAKHYLYSNILYDDVYVGEPTDKDCIEMFKAGANWQKTKNEFTTEDLGEYINELSKQFPEVSFAKLSRIAVRVAKWQEQRGKEALNLYLKSQWNKGK